MTIQTINIGNVVNDGLGDDLRTAFQKVNANFSSLQASLIVTASNAAGNSGQGIVANGTGSKLTFKNLLAGTKINLEGFTDSIRISSTQPDAFTRIDTDLGIIEASNHQNITIQGSPNINVTASGQVITIDTDRNLEELLTTLDFGPINQNFFNTLQFTISSLNVDMGTISNSGDFYIDLGTI
jgi:hypothetical protein